jgi:hypothetical protein
METSSRVSVHWVYPPRDPRARTGGTAGIRPDFGSFSGRPAIERKASRDIWCAGVPLRKNEGPTILKRRPNQLLAGFSFRNCRLKITNCRLKITHESHMSFVLFPLSSHRIFQRPTLQYYPTILPCPGSMKSQRLSVQRLSLHNTTIMNWMIFSLCLVYPTAQGTYTLRLHAFICSRIIRSKSSIYLTHSVPPNQR